MHWRIADNWSYIDHHYWNQLREVNYLVSMKLLSKAWTWCRDGYLSATAVIMGLFHRHYIHHSRSKSSWLNLENFRFTASLTSEYKRGEMALPFLRFFCWCRGHSSLKRRLTWHPKAIGATPSPFTTRIHLKVRQSVANSDQFRNNYDATRLLITSSLAFLLLQKNYNNNLPSPLLIGFDGQSENAFEGQHQQRNGQIPEIGIRLRRRIPFDGSHSPDSHESVSGKNQPRQDRLENVHHLPHDFTVNNSIFNFSTLKKKWFSKRH